jgi:nucleotide-binding universal stress UspA family protein
VKVLYVTDGFPVAEPARALLAAMADRAKVDLTVMSVTETGFPTLEHLPTSLDPLEARRTDAVKIVDAAVESLRAEGFRATGRTTEGHVGDAIVRAVEEDWYDITVMGAGSRNWLGQLLLGSVSTYVLHSSPSSVLIVHEASPSSPVRILLGTDGSRGSDRAIRSITQMADPERCAVTALAVAPTAPMVLPVPGSTASFDPKVAAEIDRDVTERAGRLAQRGATQLQDAGLKVESRVAHGHPTEQLLKEAEAGSFDLIAVGSQGSGPVGRALLRSVSDQVVRHARATLIARRLKD